MTTKKALPWLLVGLVLAIVAIAGLLAIQQQQRESQQQQNLLDAMGDSKGYEQRQTERQRATLEAQIIVASNIAVAHPDDPSAFTNALNSLRRGNGAGSQ